jgi:hypothetical protein
VKLKSIQIVVVACLALGLIAALGYFFLVGGFEKFPQPAGYLMAGLVVVLYAVLTFWLRFGAGKTQRRVKQVLAELGFEKEPGLSQQYRGVVAGWEAEILPFRAKGYGDTTALQILLRGTFGLRLLIALPNGLTTFAIWSAETALPLAPRGYAGLEIFTNDRAAANALLGQPEMQAAVRELFSVPTQTPLVLEIAEGLIRLRVGRLAAQLFDAETLRAWLRILGKIGQLAGHASPQPAADFALDPSGEVPGFRSSTPWAWLAVLLLLFLFLLVILIVFLRGAF